MKTTAQVQPQHTPHRPSMCSLRKTRTAPLSCTSMLCMKSGACSATGANPPLATCLAPGHRSATREKALQGLAMLMMTSYCYDDCIERCVIPRATQQALLNTRHPSHRIETLTSLLQTSVKRGASVEAALAAKCLALLVLQIGAGPDALEYVGPSPIPSLFTLYCISGCIAPRPRCCARV